MSDDVRTMPTLEELGEGVEIRRYRLGFPHALALAASAILILAAASAMLALVARDAETFAPGLDERLTAWGGARQGEPAPETERADAREEEPDLWSRAKARGDDLLSSLERALANVGRAQAEQQLTDAFTKLDQRDPAQLRDFLAAHKGNPYAEEMGYLPAVRRAIADRRVYRPGDIVACGDCWCWVEPPVSPDDPTATQ